MSVLIKGGRVITAADDYVGDVYVEGERVSLIGESLEPLRHAFAHAARTRRVIRQNLIWTYAYNAVAIPLAMAGWVEPYAAAIGMAASSLVVVLHALRLARLEVPA